MKASHSYRPFNQPRSPFALERNLIIPLLLFGALLLGVLFHCGYHFLHNLTFLKEYLPSSFALLVAPHYTAQLYVASYSGVITTLSLKGRTLTTANTTEGCGGSPSWLTRHYRSVLLCLDEGLKSDVGGLSAFEIGDDGSLEKLDGMTTEFGPVSAVTFGDEDDGLALAHYGGSAFSTWDITDPNFMAPIQAFNYTLSQPGPNPARQEASHPHQAVLDPTRRFILVPDLGADLVRIYRVDNIERMVKDHEPLVVAPGSGPRHLAFAVQEETTFMYLVTELGNTVVGYEVSYGGDSVMFEEIWSSGIHGHEKEVPEGAQASEVVVSPDASFLIISSRNENSFIMPNIDMTNRTLTPSDPLINFAIDSKTGHLNLLQEVASGGRGPRQFSMNKAGSLVAVGLQNDGRVVIIERDVKTGLLGEVVAWANVAGEVTAVIFNEDEDEDES